MDDIDKMIIQALEEAAGGCAITSENFNDVVFRTLNNVNAQSDQVNYLVSVEQANLVAVRPDIKPKQRINLASAQNDAELELMMRVLHWRTYAKKLNIMIKRLKPMWKDNG